MFIMLIDIVIGDGMTKSSLHCELLNIIIFSHHRDNHAGEFQKDYYHNFNH